MSGQTLEEQLASLSWLIDKYKVEQSERRAAYLDGKGSASEWQYYAGLVEGLRIARRILRDPMPVPVLEVPVERPAPVTLRGIMRMDDRS